MPITGSLFDVIVGRYQRTQSKCPPEEAFVHQGVEVVYHEKHLTPQKETSATRTIRRLAKFSKKKKNSQRKWSSIALNPKETVVGGDTFFVTYHDADKNESVSLDTVSTASHATLTTYSSPQDGPHDSTNPFDHTEEDSSVFTTSPGQLGQISVGDSKSVLSEMKDDIDDITVNTAELAGLEQNDYHQQFNASAFTEKKSKQQHDQNSLSAASSSKPRWWYEGYGDDDVMATDSVDSIDCNLSQVLKENDPPSLNVPKDESTDHLSEQNDNATSTTTNDEIDAGQKRSIENEIYEQVRDYFNMQPAAYDCSISALDNLMNLSSINDGLSILCPFISTKKSSYDDIDEVDDLRFQMENDADMQNLEIKQKQIRDRKLHIPSLDIEGLSEFSDDFAASSNCIQVEKSTSESVLSLNKDATSEPSQTEKILNTLSNAYNRAEHVKTIIDENPSIVEEVLNSRKQLPLHITCDRGFPMRSLKRSMYASQSPLRGNSSVSDELDEVYSSGFEAFVNDLISDITNHRVLLKVVAWANIDACHCPDGNSDLPVHLLARRLLEWERVWHAEIKKVKRWYHMTATDAARLTTLYQTISQCVEVVLRPICSSTELCKITGSCGTMLPIHIATMFEASYDTLRQLLERYPEGTEFKYNSDTNGAASSSHLALEILETREERKESQLEKNNENARITEAGVRWSSSIIDYVREDDFLRRSDLVFAFNPDILPYKKEAARWQRIESTIKTEAKQNVKEPNLQLSLAMANIWIWMCTYTNEKDERDNFSKNVSRIVDDLDISALDKLIKVDVGCDSTILEIANPYCREAITRKLQKINKREVTELPPIKEEKSLPVLEKKSEFRSILKTGKVTNKTWKPIRHSQDMGRLCKVIFNVREDSFPTSFIVLPYKLKLHTDGAPTLLSKADTNTAKEFAKLLLKLSESSTLYHILETKFNEGRGVYIREKMKTQMQRHREQFEIYQQSLLELYNAGNSYLYLLDECSGTPMVPTEDEVSPIYPITVNNPGIVVKKLLPLMCLGMTMMRGDRALSTLAEVAARGSPEYSPSAWKEAAQDIVNYMYNKSSTSSHDRSEPSSSETLHDDLIQFVSKMSTESAKRLDLQDGSEWVVELSFLKIMLTKFDSKRTFMGLQRMETRHGSKLWTKDTSREDLVHRPQNQLLGSIFKAEFIEGQLELDKDQLSVSDMSGMSSIYTSTETIGENNLTDDFLQYPDEDGGTKTTHTEETSSTNEQATSLNCVPEIKSQEGTSLATLTSHGDDSNVESINDLYFSDNSENDASDQESSKLLGLTYSHEQAQRHDIGTKVDSVGTDVGSVLKRFNETSKTKDDRCDSTIASRSTCWTEGSKLTKWTDGFGTSMVSSSGGKYMNNKTNLSSSNNSAYISECEYTDVGDVESVQFTEGSFPTLLDKEQSTVLGTIDSSDDDDSHIDELINKLNQPLTKTLSPAPSSAEKDDFGSPNIKKEEDLKFSERMKSLDELRQRIKIMDERVNRHATDDDASNAGSSTEFSVYTEEILNDSEDGEGSDIDELDKKVNSLQLQIVDKELRVEQMKLQLQAKEISLIAEKNCQLLRIEQLLSTKEKEFSNISETIRNIS